MNKIFSYNVSQRVHLLFRFLLPFRILQDLLNLLDNGRLGQLPFLQDLLNLEKHGERV